MNCKLIFLLYSILLSAVANAQKDPFEGSWQMNYLLPGTALNLDIRLQVGVAERGILYPSELTFNCDSFHATYHLLLVKRNIRQLAIGRNKVPASESPFTLGTATCNLNGVFDLSRDLKGNPVLV